MNKSRFFNIGRQLGDNHILTFFSPYKICHINKNELISMIMKINCRVAVGMGVELT